MHSRAARQWWDVLSDFGGLFDIIYIPLILIVGMYNDDKLIDKVIKELYKSR